ncbi:MAG: M60 family peptidase N-terminal accessory domain-containing protein, partial [Phycisphaeraceae bacterium]|nr:M60 family peptidase N-terminal accessory domain-containing protein [Phycisphaeraceae bacterium]
MTISLSVCRRLLLVAPLLLALLTGCAGSGQAPVAEAEEDRGPLIEATAALTAHVEGEAELTSEQIKAHTQTINDHAQALAENEAALKAAQTFIRTYDRTLGPLYVNTPLLHKKKKDPAHAIHWAAFWVMQNVLDQVYNDEGLATWREQLEGFRFGTADYFPGKVQQPVTDGPYTVKIQASYPETWGAPMFHMERPARKPTGAYLKPGDIATVTVPPALVDKGYQVRVGAHSWDLTRKPKTNRLHRVTTLYDIDDTEVEVANPLGGGIYIEVPYKADGGGVVEVTVENAARSPYFSWKDFHRTTLEQWRETERHFKAPWADFQTDKFMMQVPTSWIYELDDPAPLMEDWDRSMDVMNDLMGRP